MKTFIFIQQKGSAVITLSAISYEEALLELEDIVLDPDDFRVEDEEGEEE